MNTLGNIALVILTAVIVYNNKGFVMDPSPFALTAEWFDEEAALTRSFRMLYYPSSNKIQLYEPKTQRLFLKKSLVEGIKQDDIFVGNTILILARMFTITDYADEYTRFALSSKTERTFAMIKPDAVKHMGSVLECVQQNGLKIRAASMALMTELHAAEFYQEHTGKPFLPNLIKYVTSGPVLAMELQGENAVLKWRKFIGPTDPVQALAEDPTSLRARFGTDKTFNGFHGSDSSNAALREISFFFPRDARSKETAPQSSAIFRNCTCCVVKPHIIQEGLLGSLLTAIQEGGFTISGLELVRFDRASAAEFHEIYDGVLFEYMDMVTQLQSGPSIVLEITPTEKTNDEFQNHVTNGISKDNHEGRYQDDPVEAFRQLVGPLDPELAKKIRPKSLRAQFGKTKVLNALHCTDLTEDGKLEVEYAFKIMRGR